MSSWFKTQFLDLVKQYGILIILIALAFVYVNSCYLPLSAGDKTYYSLDSLIKKEHYNTPFHVDQHKVVKGDSLIIGYADDLPGYSIHYNMATDSGYLGHLDGRIPLYYHGEQEYLIRRKSYIVYRIYAPSLNWVFFIEAHLGIVMIRFGKGDTRKYCVSEHINLDKNRLSRNLIDSLISQPLWISEVVDSNLVDPVQFQGGDSFMIYLKSKGAKW